MCSSEAEREPRCFLMEVPGLVFCSSQNQDQHGSGCENHGLHMNEFRNTSQATPHPREVGSSKRYQVLWQQKGGK